MSTRTCLSWNRPPCSLRVENTMSTANFPEFEMFMLSKDYMEILGRETENLFIINRKAEGEDRYFE